MNSIHHCLLIGKSYFRRLCSRLKMKETLPLDLRVPNVLTANVLSRADQGEDLKHFASADDLYASWASVRTSDG